MPRIIRKTSKKTCTHKCNSSLFSKSLSQSNKNKLTSSFESWLELTSQHNVTIRKQNKTNVFDDIRGNAYELKTFKKIHFSTILWMCVCLSSVLQKWSTSKIVYCTIDTSEGARENVVCLASFECMNTAVTNHMVWAVFTSGSSHRL